VGRVEKCNVTFVPVTIGQFMGQPQINMIPIMSESLDVEHDFWCSQCEMAIAEKDVAAHQGPHNLDGSTREKLENAIIVVLQAQTDKTATYKQLETAIPNVTPFALDNIFFELLMEGRISEPKPKTYQLRK
jgi:hypothetical protein